MAQEVSIPDRTARHPTIEAHAPAVQSSRGQRVALPDIDIARGEVAERKHGYGDQGAVALLEIRHELGGDAIRHLPLDLERLGASLVLAFTGQSHFSAGQNWQIVRRRLDGDAEVVTLLQGIADVATELAAALERDDLPAAGGLLGREWGFRRRLADGVSTPAIEDLLERGRAAGAWGGKACGAGGGGCIALLCPQERHGEVTRALASGGAVPLPARPVSGGLEVTWA